MIDKVQKVLIYPDYASRGVAANALKLKCKSVSVSPDATLTQSPVETGVFINDCKVRRPTTIQMHVVLEIVGEWYSTVKALRTLHEQFVVTGEKAIKATKDKLAVVQTKDGIYTNMVLLNFPHTEGVENFSTFEFTLKFQELMMSGSAAISSVEDPKDKKPVNGGKK